MSLFNINISNIFGNNNKVAQDGSKIGVNDQLTQSLISQLGEFQKSSPYSICTIEVNKTNIQPQDCLIRRPDHISAVCHLLDEYGCVIIDGEILIGKTSLAEAVGIEMKEYEPVMLRMHYNKALNPYSLIPVVAAHGNCKLLIIDGFPEYGTEETEDLCKVIVNGTKTGLKILITTRSFNSVFSSKYCFGTYSIPPITIDELMNSEQRCTESLAKLLIASSGGYPMLLNLLLAYLEVNNWGISSKQIIDFITIPSKSDVQRYTNSKIRELFTDEIDLIFLSRISLFWRSFTVDDAVAIAEVSPIIGSPRARIDKLLSQKILINDGVKLKVSPYIKKVWTIDLLDVEYKSCCNVIIDRIVHKHTINILDADNIVMLLCEAKEFERAGIFYITCMSKVLEGGLQKNSQITMLTMLWRDLPLPSQMSLSTRAFIRILQMQIASDLNEDCTYALQDIQSLINQMPKESPLKSIASCYAIAQLAQNGDIQHALTLLQYALPDMSADFDDRYQEVVKEQREISCKLPVLLLANVKSVDDLIQWFDKIELSRISTECIDADVAKYILNKVVVGEDVEQTLTTIIEKSADYSAQTVILTMAVARQMLYFTNHKRFEDCMTLYNRFNGLAETELGTIVINNALACYYSDCGNIDKALEIWETACRNNALSIAPEEVMFARTAQASIFTERGNYSEAVRCHENIVLTQVFSVLDVYQKMQMHGELSIAYWNNGQRKDTFEQLLIIHEYLFDNRLYQDENYKLLELKFGVCVQQYHHLLEKGTMQEQYLKPVPTLFQHRNEQLLEAYNDARTRTNSMFLFMVASALSIPKDQAYTIAIHTVDCFEELIKGKNFACALLNELIPLLLEYNDYDKVECLLKSTLSLVPLMQGVQKPLQLVEYLPLLPLCLKKVIDTLNGDRAEIDSLVNTYISELYSIYRKDDDVRNLYKILVSHDDVLSSSLKNDTAKISVRLCNFDELNVQTSINVMIIASMFMMVHKYYGLGLLRQYIYLNGMHILRKFESNYRNPYKDAVAEFDKVNVTEKDDTIAVKKMITVLIAYSKVEIPLTSEHESFIEYL